MRIVYQNVAGLDVHKKVVVEAIIAGDASPEVMAELAKGRMREKRASLAKALEGRVKAHHRFPTWATSSTPKRCCTKPYRR